MPIYEYNCDQCNYKFDRMVTSHKAQMKCPLCQGEVKKLMSSFSVGASNNIAGGIPADMGPKMCTNCGPSPPGFNQNQPINQRPPEELRV